MQKKNTRISPNRASLSAIDSQRRQLSVESIISVGTRDIAVCVNILVRIRNQSHPLALDDDVVDNDRHGEQSKTEMYFRRKPFCTGAP